MRHLKTTTTTTQTTYCRCTWCDVLDFDFIFIFFSMIVRPRVCMCWTVLGCAWVRFSLDSLLGVSEGFPESAEVGVEVLRRGHYLQQAWVHILRKTTATHNRQTQVNYKTHWRNRLTTNKKTAKTVQLISKTTKTSHLCVMSSATVLTYSASIWNKETERRGNSWEGEIHEKGKSSESVNMRSYY